MQTIQRPLLFAVALLLSVGSHADAAKRSGPKHSENRSAPASQRAHNKNYCFECARDARGRIKRKQAAKHRYQNEHPCPSTGSRSGGCPGYVVDHVKPLACGGTDAPSNMGWQTKAEARAKDKVERKGCQ
jgi:hypothetical protein